MLWHVEHWFLAVSAFIQMLMAFPVTWLAYNYILQSTYIGVLDLLSLFICIAIGVDDVFVFSDTFMKAEVLPDMADRLGYTYRKAGAAMLITSITTAMAFSANMGSSIPAIRSFGSVLGLLTLANYMLVMTAFPVTVAFYNYAFNKKPALNDIMIPQEEPEQVRKGVEKPDVVEEIATVEMDALVNSTSMSAIVGQGSGHGVLVGADVDLGGTEYSNENRRGLWCRFVNALRVRTAAIKGSATSRVAQVM